MPSLPAILGVIYVATSNELSGLTFLFGPGPLWIGHKGEGKG